MARRSLSHWSSIVEESNNGADIWAGIDVHKNSYSVALLSANGVLHTYRTVADSQALIEQFKFWGIKLTSLVYEAGFTGFTLARVCQSAGIKVMVVSANKIPRPPSAGPKSDSLDCQNLALLAAKGLLKPIAIPTPEQEAERTLIRRRAQLTRGIRCAKQRIKSFLVCHSIEAPNGLKYWNKQGRELLAQLPVGEILGRHLHSLIRELDFLESEKRQIEAEIKHFILPQVDVLQSVPGVGPTISATFRAEVFSPERFSHSSELSSFLGLAPCISQSGESKSKGKLMVAGQANLRSLLIEACWILKRREKWAEDFYRRIMQRCGRCQQAISALARKLAILLWRLLIENRAYQSNYTREQPALSGSK